MMGVADLAINTAKLGIRLMCYFDGLRSKSLGLSARSGIATKRYCDDLMHDSTLS
jgi:hypothetical protein